MNAEAMRAQIAEDEKALERARRVERRIAATLRRSRLIRRKALPQLKAKGVVS